MQPAHCSVAWMFLVMTGCSLVTKTDLSDLEPPADAGTDDAGSDACNGPEVCNNNADEDCDDQVDEDCGTTMGEDCNTPQPIGLSSMAITNTAGFSDDMVTTCANATESPDVIFSLTLAQNRDLDVRTFGSDFDTVLALRDDCANIESELACSNNANSSGTSRVVYRNLAVGDYFLIVEGDVAAIAGDLTLTTSAVSSPSQRTCNNAYDISSGATVHGSTNGDMQDLEAGSCGGDDAPEEVFVFSVTSTVQFTAHTLGTPLEVLYLRRDSCSSGNEVICSSTGSITDVTLTPGSYYLFVDGAEEVVGEYRLVAFFATN